MCCVVARQASDSNKGRGHRAEVERVEVRVVGKLELLQAAVGERYAHSLELIVANTASKFELCDHLCGLQFEMDPGSHSLAIGGPVGAAVLTHASIQHIFACV